MYDAYFLKNRSGLEVSIERLSGKYILALQLFNKNLSDQTRSQFLPHKYDEKTILKYIERNNKEEDRIYVALSEDHVIAYFFLWDYIKSFPVLGIGITDAHQGQGLGKQLMAILIKDAKSKGSDGVLLTTVLTNIAAYQLYLKMGFQYLGNTKNMAGDGRIVEERMMYLPFNDHVKPEVHDFEPPIVG